MNKFIPISILASFFFTSALQATTIYVGPDEPYKTIGSAMYDVTDGDTIIVRDGTYNHDLIVRNQLTIMAEHKHKAIIGDTGAIEGILQIRRNNVTIDGFKFNRTDKHGIVVGGNSEETQASNCVIKNNVIIGRRMGILVSGFADNCVIDSNIIRECDENGIHHNGRGAHTISNNRIEGNQHGIVITESFSGSVVITGDTIIRNRNNGVELQKSNVTLLGNIIRDNTENGIMARHDINNIIISDSNLVDSSGISGIVIEWNTNVSVDSNIIRDNTDQGIDIMGGGSASISGNLVKKNGMYGILNQGSATIMGNSITENVIHGIESRSGSSKTWIENNHITNNNASGVLLQVKADVRGNTITGNGRSGIDLDMTSETVNITDSNLVSSNTEHGIFISYNSAALVLDNTISYNGTGITNGEDFSGILIDGSATVERNSIENNHGAGIRVEPNSTNTTISNNFGINLNNWGIKMYGPATVNNNTISNNVKTGVLIGAANDITLKGDTIFGNATGVYIGVGATNISLQNNYITDNQRGVVSRGDVELRRNTIQGNTEAGITIREPGMDLGQDSDEEAGNNTIGNNSPWNVINLTADTILACRNYWGIIDTLEIDSLIQDDNEDALIGPVIYLPFIEADVTGIDYLFPRSPSKDNRALQNIFPNPFRNVANINYALTKPSRVTIKVSDLNGRSVATLVAGLPHDAGPYTLQWDGTTSNGSQVKGGIYLVVMVTESNVYSRLVQILR